MKKLLVVILFFGVCQFKAVSQNKEVYVGLDLPLYYSLGYEHKLSEHISLNGKLGVLTTPFDVTILEIFKALDINEILVNTIGDAFSIGVNLQPSVKWYFKKTYIGLSYSFLILKANECPTEAIQNYYRISIPNRRSTSLALQSYLHNAGIIVGRKFIFKNPKCSINLEFSLLKTITSINYLKDQNGQTMESLSKAIDNELGQYFSKYGYLPSLNVMFAYKL